MSFQTFNLFNFFQQPNTGKIPEPNSFVTIPSIDSIKSGKVADYNWSFPYINRSIPEAIFKSNQEGVFPISLFSDALFEGLIGIRRPLIFNNISGGFYEDINKEFYNLNISGYFFPHEKDFSNSKIILSGQIKEDPSQLNLFKNYISGEILSGGSDFNILNQKISGEIIDAKTNFGKSEIKISGKINDERPFKNINFFKISGNFFPLQKDSANIEYEITGYSVGISPPKYNVEKSDEITSLNYYISEYSVE
jgi:hypothetical protein